MPLVHERISLDQGEILLRTEFASVTRHDFVSKLLVPSPDPVAAYVRSMSEATRQADPEPLIAAVTSRLPLAQGTVLQVTTHSGCLVCA